MNNQDIIDLLIEFYAPKYENVLADTPEKAKALNCRLGDMVQVEIVQTVKLVRFDNLQS